MHPLAQVSPQIDASGLQAGFPYVSIDRDF
jgi:hypothetical protein